MKAGICGGIRRAMRRALRCPPLSCRTSPPHGGRSAVSIAFASRQRCRCSANQAAADLPPCGGDVRQDRGGRCPASVSASASPASTIQTGAPVHGRWAVRALTILIAFTPLSTSADPLPAGFVHLSTVAPDIRQHIAYAGADNFLGRPAKGYEAPACILTDQAARALTKAQQAASEQNLSLVVFDCYRPRQAVADFVAWVEAGGEIATLWSPRTERNRLIAEGYVGRRSTHSRGSTVDVALVAKGAPAAPKTLDCGIAAPNMLDFGSGFDCFDPRSRTAFKPQPETAARNRTLLVAIMAKAGFKNYAGEWWHFTLRREPSKQAYDFPVTAPD